MLLLGHQRTACVFVTGFLAASGFADPATGQSFNGSSQSEPPASADSSAPDDPIIVVAPRRDGSSIDATRYIVKQNAEANVLTALELLGRIPFVSVSVDDRIQILGRSGVTILVDGQEVVDQAALLRSLRANRLESVEVVTNPSARYSADSRGGIINLRLRRDASEQLSGSASASANSLGGSDFSLSPSVSFGKVAIVASASLNRNIQEQASNIRRIPAGNSNQTRQRVEDSKSHSETISPFFSASVTNPFGDTRRLILDVLASKSRTIREISAESLVDKGELSRDERAKIAFDNKEGSLAYEGGDEQKDYLKIRGGLTASSSSTFLTASGAGDALFSFKGRDAKSSVSASVDWVKQRRPAHRLRIGAGAGRYNERRSSKSEFFTSGTEEHNEFNARGIWTEASLYSDYQFPFAKGELLLGVRVEDRNYDVGFGSGKSPHYLGVFPSIHFERSILVRNTLRASYSRKVSWPSLLDLTPLLRFTNSLTAARGNPDLRPETGNSFELSLLRRAGGTQLGATAYYTDTQQLFSILAELTGEVLIYRPVNAGTSKSIGLSAFARGKIVDSLTYNVSGSLFWERQNGAPSDGVNLETSSRRGAGDIQLEYNEKREQGPGADIVRMNLNYRSRIEKAFFSIAPQFTAGGSWTHRFTKKMSAVLTVSGVQLLPLRPVVYRSRDGTFLQSDRSRGPEIKLSLTSSFGKQ